MAKIKTGLFNFFNSLLNSFKTDTLLANTMDQFEELNGNIKKMYAVTLKLEFNSELHNTLHKQLGKHMSDHRTNAYVTLQKLIEKIAANQTEFEDAIENNFADMVVKERMDYYKVNLLKYVESLTFFNDYAKKFAMALMIEEFSEDDVKDIFTVIDRTQLAYVMDRDNMYQFCRIAKNLEYPVKDVLKSFEKLRGIPFDEETYDATKAVNGAKIDPMQQGFLPVSIDPVYHVGLLFNDFKEARRKKLKDEMIRFNLEVEYLRGTLEGADKKTQDNIKKQIKYYSDMINKHNGVLEDISEGE